MRRGNIHRLSAERVREVLAYNPDTGDLIWRKRLGPMCNLGGPAGCVKKDGYRKITIDGVICNASQLAWLHYHGTPAPGLLDHKNGIRSDNRMSNLRPATHSENSRNVGVRANNSSGLKGAQKFYNRYNRAKFRSTITVDKKRIFLGLFMTAEEAHEAYCRAAREMHGEFFRTHKPMEIPVSPYKKASADLIRKLPDVGAHTPRGRLMSCAAEQLNNMETYERPSWATDERQTLPYQLKKTLDRLAA
jgi:hypothetical protein